MTDLDLDEWRMAVRDLSEAEREENCGHTSRGRAGQCYECGNEAER